MNKPTKNKRNTVDPKDGKLEFRVEAPVLVLTYWRLPTPSSKNQERKSCSAAVLPVAAVTKSQLPGTSLFK